MHPLDYFVLVGYLVGVAAFGILAGGKQTSASDYFLGDRNLPWWAVAFSVIATETSTLTVISIPGVAYFGALTFLQLTFGYLIGRLAVSAWFLPRYFSGEQETAYQFLEERFGGKMRVTASITFILTRLLADGIRLFATAIPVKVIADAVGLELSLVQIIAITGLVTIAYTYVGGLKAVVWMDVVQMFIYLGGALAALYLLWTKAPDGWFTEAVNLGKTSIFDWDGVAATDPLAGRFAAILTSPYAFITAIFGGAVLSMASHGTDHIIVQRLLGCRNLGDARKALIGSGIFVIGQFALFLLVGLALWGYYGGIEGVRQGLSTAEELARLGLSSADQIFPRFIRDGLPPGLSGLMLAGILAAAMSTVAGSLNSLASSTMLDLYGRLSGRTLDDKTALRASRIATLVWGLVFILFASLFRDQKNPVVELGLSIASFTYGGLLGVYLLGMLNRRATERDAIVAFMTTVVVMTFVIFGVWYSVKQGHWLFSFRPSGEEKAALGLKGLAYPWYVVVGSALTIAVGSLMSRFGPPAPLPPADVRAPLPPVAPSVG